MSESDLAELERVLTAAGGFGHREHVELAWRYLERYELPRAQQTMAEAIRRLAARHDMPAKYHQTLTLAWVHLVAVHRLRRPAEGFDAFLALSPELLDRALVQRHYSEQRLWSEPARTCWIEPDLPLPVLSRST